MEIKAVIGDISQMQTGALVVNLFEGMERPGGATAAVDRALDGAIAKLIAEGEIRGKRGEMTLIHTLGKMPATRVLVVGLGKEKDFNQETVRSVTAEACRHLRRLGVKRAVTIAHGAGVGGLDARASGQAIAEGALLGLYEFDRHMSKKNDNQHEVEALQVVEKERGLVAELEEGIAAGKILAEATALCRDLVNEPANLMTPTKLTEAAQKVAQECSLEITVLERAQAEELGMGAFLGVAKGSHQPPKFIILKYNGDPSNPSKGVGLLGKGITFDSGGISLKPAEGMGEMKGDMAGGASVIAALKAISQLRPKINVTGIIPATENMPGGEAQRPGDIVRAMSGKTIEIENTDAEGRLVLADALCYARKIGLSPLVDVATLTGAMRVALGTVCTGIMGNHQPLVDRIIAVGQKTGERMWQLPLFDDYKEQNKSTVADVKNTGGRPAGAITAAQFLHEFAEDTPWAHLDIAGTSMTEKEKGYEVKGATGVPVRTLVALALSLEEKPLSD